MSNIKVNFDRCKGCFLCVSVCPKGALTPSKELGAKGYEIVSLDKEKCIGCGSCFRMCPDYCIEISD